MICDYGCGNKARFKFKNGKVCCSESQNSCEKMRKDHSQRMMGNNNPMFGKNRIFSNEEVKKQVEGRLLTIEKIRKKYPFFSQVEELRYNPKNDKEIQVHCKNHLCKNSKEMGGWFSPSRSQLIERRRALEHPEGNDGRYFYCSNKCKMECPLYDLKSDPLQTSKTIYLNSEYKVFRKFVLERDKYICQFCGKKATHVHHERPQKLEPFFALDPDYAWSCCKKCHYKKGHKDECSTGKIASKICI